MTLNVVKGKFMWAKLTKKEQLTEDLWKMWLKPEEKFDFKPGQYCTIGSGGIERAYSIASSPDEDQIELFIELVPPPDGNLTPLLNELNVGDTVTMRLRAKGIFCTKTRVQKPCNGRYCYRSCSIRKYDEKTLLMNLNHQIKNFIILEGASYLDEFGYDEELMLLDKSNNNVTFEASVSRPDEERNESWTGYKGRVNNILLDRLDEWGLNPSETIVYACGHPGMIEDVKRKIRKQ